MTVDPFLRWNLTPLVNASGTMTGIGASRVPDEVRATVDRILASFVDMDELQSRAGAVIARVTGAEAGCVASCTAAAMSQTIAACLTGANLAKIESIPTVAGERRVLLPMGHMVNYGAPVGQAIRLAGVEVVPVGTAAACETWHLADAVAEGAAAALYVVSHHTVRENELPMDVFIDICREHDVPVIVDMASEYDLTGPVALGASAAIYSGHKFLAGVTSGIVAGRSDLIRATYLQHRGIGRTMKAGKESVVGAMAALEIWEKRDHAAARRAEEARVALWMRALAALPNEADLAVIAAQVAGGRARRGTPGEQRPRHDPHRVVERLVGEHVGDRRPQPRPDEPGMRQGGPRQRHHALDRELARLEQPPDGHDVLVADVPHLPVAAHRVQPVDVQSGSPGGMDAGELLPPEPIAGRHRHPAVRRRAHVDGAVGHPRQRLQAVLEGPVRPVEHDVDPRGQRLGVDGGHEDGARPRSRIGDAPERPLPNRRPQARLDQQLAHVVAAEPGGISARERGKPDRDAAAALLLVPAEGDDDGPEAAALPAVDRLDGAGGRRREPDAGPLLVLEQQLAPADVVTLRDVHGGPEADVVVGQQRHPPRRPGGTDRLIGLSRDRQPQSLANDVSPHTASGEEPVQERIERPGPPTVARRLRLAPNQPGRNPRGSTAQAPGAALSRDDVVFNRGQVGTGKFCEVFLKLPRRAEATVRRATRIQKKGSCAISIVPRGAA